MPRPPVARESLPPLTFELPDRLGTSIRQTDANTGTLATRTYDAFGALTASAGTPKGPFGFAGGHGYQEDADSGLKLLGHRYYDASTGRFLTRDPAKDGRNWYAYCEGNPLRYIDPTGLTDWENTGFAGGMRNRSSKPIRVIFDRGGVTYYIDVLPGYETTDNVDADWTPIKGGGWQHIRGGTVATGTDKPGGGQTIRFPNTTPFQGSEPPEYGAWPPGWEKSNGGKGPKPYPNPERGKKPLVVPINRPWTIKP